MESNLHAHVISLHIQDRIAFAEHERLARDVRPSRKLRFHLPRRTAPTPLRKVGAGPA